VENAIKSLVSSAILDPNVKGALRWPLGKESIGERFSLVGVWHTNYKAFRNKTLRFKLRHSDWFDHRSSTREVSNEVSFKLIGISNRLQVSNRKLIHKIISCRIYDIIEQVTRYFVIFYFYAFYVRKCSFLKNVQIIFKKSNGI
jgi:hypothetical protein